MTRSPVLPGMFDVPETVDMRPLSRTERLAAFFRAHPNEWVDGLALTFAGSYAWRSRVSNLRFPPFNMTIENTIVKREDGSQQSLYRYVP